MKFTEKYEIIEMLTSGRVCTFLALDRATHEEVVLWTFESSGEAAAADASSILSSFCRLAPAPPGAVILAGSDEQRSSAFLVGKMPSRSDLDRWITVYHSFPRPVSEPTSSIEKLGASNESPAFSPKEDECVPKPFDSSSPERTAAKFSKQTDVPGDFTSFFRNPFESPAPLGDSHLPSSGGSGGEFTSMFGKGNLEPEVQPRGAAGTPGSFTQLFASEKTSIRSTELGQEAHTPTQPSEASKAGSLTQLFGTQVTPEPGPSTPSNAPGSFTQIFGPGSSRETPAPGNDDLASLSTHLEPASYRHVPGSFTQIFGSTDSLKEPGPSVSGSTADSIFRESSSSPGSFTQVFGSVPTGGPARTDPVVASVVAEPVGLAPIVSAPKVATAQPEASAQAPLEQPEPGNSPLPAAMEPPKPVQAQAIAPVKVQSRAPSEFTMFMDRSQLRSMLRPDAPEPPALEPQSEAGAPLPTPALKLPDFKPPQPKVPSVAAPKAAPAVAAAISASDASKPNSLLPLITVLIALTSIAAM